MNDLMEHIKRVARDDVRIYFAPFVGAINAVKAEINRPSLRKTTSESALKTASATAIKPANH